MKPVVDDLGSEFKISTQIDFFIRSEERLNATDKHSTCHFQHHFHHKYFRLALPLHCPRGSEAALHGRMDAPMGGRMPHHPLPYQMAASTWKQPVMLHGEKER